MDDNDSDYAIALYLQEELNKDNDAPLTVQEYSGGKPMSIIDNFWELNDPNPDIHGLFLEFNSNYFWNQLYGVEVKWSNRMTLCAGICVYEGRGGLCSIRLSLPLLKLRPRKDLVETLLHEMIHAYLFVTRNNRDHDAHGPEFCKHMYRINKLTGAKITVYHNFHDEVDSYRQHWWRCNGPCRKKPPFYGIVRRAMNRAPSSCDPWWAEHEKTCGGVFQKIKEPPKNDDKRKPQEGKGSSSPKKPKVVSADIRTFFTSGLKKGIEETVKKSFDTFKKNPHSENMGPNIHTINNQTNKTHKVPIKAFQGKGNNLGSINSINNSKASKLLSLYSSDKNSNRLHSQSNYSSTSLKVSSEIFSTPESVKSISFSSFPLNNITTKKRNSSTSKLYSASSNQNQIQSEVINLTDSPNLSEKKIRSATISTASPLNHLKDIWDDSPPVFPLFKNSPSSQKKCEDSTVKEKNEKVCQIDLTSSEVLVKCPVCSKDVIDTEINSHLDNCLC